MLENSKEVQSQALKGPLVKGQQNAGRKKQAAAVVAAHLVKTKIKTRAKHQAEESLSICWVQANKTCKQQQLLVNHRLKLSPSHRGRAQIGNNQV